MTNPVDRLRQNIASVYLGNPSAVDRLICCVVARGHVLIEDVPGVGKTVLATALARSLDCSFSRVQLTPDLLPSDILGSNMLVRADASGMSNGHANGHGYAGFSGALEFKRGPIFANIVLADEINRTPPRTQTALLEAMSEATVTVDGKTYPLEHPFMLIATQNPFDFEGTYPLPENQMDRFLMRVHLGYPSPEDEARVLTARPADTVLSQLKPVLHAADVLELQRQGDRVHMDKSLVDYIVGIATATRRHGELRVGLSPRGALALAQAARATAVISGRDFVVPEDISENVLSVCAHRVVPRSLRATSARPAADGAYPPESPEGILTSVMESLASPA